MNMKYRLLFLHPGPIPPSADPRRNSLYHLSNCCEGDLVTTRWPLAEDGHQPPPRFETLGDFAYHATVSTQLTGLIRSAWNFCYALRTGQQLARTRGPYDAIIAYGPFSLALVGWLLRRRTKTKLIVEVPGPPTEGFIFEPGMTARLKLHVARRLAPFLLRRADAIRLYYTWQLDNLPGGPFPPAYVFPDFVPLTLIPTAPNPSPRRYILHTGYPFSRKGVDVLISAFLKIADLHLDVDLEIVGHCPDRDQYERLAAGSPRIRFRPGVPHEEAMELLAGCCVFALASRMEGVPRALIEAMAAGKPVAATRASGIPALIDHGHTGLLCEVDDDAGLAANLDRLLSDPEYAGKLADAGKKYVFDELAEGRFVERTRSMLKELLGEPRIGGRGDIES